VVSVDDRANDGQPQPCAAGAACAGAVGAVKAVEDRVALALGMPGPSSSTAISTAWPEGSAVTRTRPPGCVCWIAFAIRLRSAWARRSGSARSTPPACEENAKRRSAVVRAPSRRRAGNRRGHAPIVLTPPDRSPFVRQPPMQAHSPVADRECGFVPKEQREPRLCGPLLSSLRLTLSPRLDAYSLPMTFILDSRGRIVGVLRGPQTESCIRVALGSAADLR
jgi:hypothetical protein